MALIVFIFYNYYYEREFKKPPNTYIRNIKLVQALMSMTGDLFDFQYYVIEQCFFWKSKEKTLLTLNTMLMAFLATLPILLIPLRYIVVAGIWGGMAVNSPFAMAVGQAILQILIEYGIVFERKAPILMNTFHHKLEHVYIPRAKYILSWIPYASRYLPLEPKVPPLNISNSDQLNRSSVMHQNNAFASERDNYEVYYNRPDSSVI